MVLFQQTASWEGVVRINAHASQQYRKNEPAERPRETVRTEPQASVKTTSFGFSIGKFGLDYTSRKTTLDPSLSRDVREKRQKAQSFETEQQVEELRAKVGQEGASYRDLTDAGVEAGTRAPMHRIKTALSAYAKSKADILPPAGSMLASVV